MKKIINLEPEGYGLVMQLKYKGKTTLLRTYQDRLGLMNHKLQLQWQGYRIFICPKYCSLPVTWKEIRTRWEKEVIR